MTLIQLLQSGGALRYRPTSGFYVVLAGKSVQVTEAEARAAVTSKAVVPNGKDNFGVYLFALNTKAANAVPAVHRHPSALPKRPAGVPPALPDVHPMRCKADPKTPAAVPAHGRAAPGQVQGGAGSVAGHGARRSATEGAGQGRVGCGGEGVTA